MHKRKKPRLYLCLHVRGGTTFMKGGEDRYHWSLLLAPKVPSASTSKPGKQGTRYHAKERATTTGTGLFEWKFCREIVRDSDGFDGMMLARLLLGKVRNVKKLDQIFASIPIKGKAWSAPKTELVAQMVKESNGQRQAVGLGGEENGISDGAISDEKTEQEKAQTNEESREERWNCVNWVREALETLSEDGNVLGAGAITDWERIRSKALEYVRSKRDEGRYTAGEDFNDRVSTWDLMRDCEIMA